MKRWRSRGSSGGVATGYGFYSRQRKRICLHSAAFKPVMEPTQPPTGSCFLADKAAET
jgi:hypothetical protein